MRTYHPSLRGWPIPWMANMHDHYRFLDGMMRVVIPEAAKQFRYATAMPNFQKDRIRLPEQAFEYKARVEAIGRKVNPLFDVNVPLYLEVDTDPNVVREGFKQGAWIAAKMYPRGGTTNSAEGVDFRDLEKLNPVFDVMEEIGMLLLVHAEPQFEQNGTPIDVFDREGKAHTYLWNLMHKHPKLKLVIEHVTTKSMVKLLTDLKRLSYTVGATIAPQYLEWTRSSLFQGGMNPVRYSIPVLQREEDRQALIDFMLSSDIAFLGTDCAPHPMQAKSRAMGCPGGVFNNPAALNVYFKYFAAAVKEGTQDWLDRFVEFACLRGPRFYGLPVDETDALLVVEEEWTMPETYGTDPNQVIPMFAGEKMTYGLERLKV